MYINVHTYKHVIRHCCPYSHCCIETGYLPREKKKLFNEDVFRINGLRGLNEDHGGIDY